MCELVFSVIAGLCVVVLVGAIAVAGVALICRPLGHQCEWEKRQQGEDPLKKINQQDGE